MARHSPSPRSSAGIPGGPRDHRPAAEGRADFHQFRPAIFIPLHRGILADREPGVVRQDFRIGFRFAGWFGRSGRFGRSSRFGRRRPRFHPLFDKLLISRRQPRKGHPRRSRLAGNLENSLTVQHVHQFSLDELAVRTGPHPGLGLQDGSGETGHENHGSKRKRQGRLHKAASIAASLSLSIGRRCRFTSPLKDRPAYQIFRDAGTSGSPCN